MLEDTVPVPAGGAADTPELESGTEVAGYVVDGKIGEGGMGKVYGAHHPRIAKRVAIKVLERSYCNDASAVARFEQEARLVNEIRHPNIVDVFHFGELPDKRSFIVMECLTGETLSARIERGPLTIRATIAILDAICDALEAAHEHGVVHRDLKSDNVFLATTRGKSTVKLLDFGIAKLAGKNDLASIGKTASGIVVGTPAYMSPEQAKGQTVGPKTDVYQLGVLAYKMLTRELPFQAENPFELIVQQLKTPAPSPKKLAPNTPDVLARLVVRMMAKTAEERPSVAEVRAVFAQLYDARTKKPGVSRATGALIGLTLFLAAAVAVGALWLVQKNKESASTQVATTAPPVAAAGSNVAAPPTTPPPTPPPPPGPAVAATTALPTPGALIDPVPAPAPEPAVEIQMEPDPVAAPTEKKSRRSRDGAAEDDDEEAAAAAAAEADEAAPVNRPGAILFRLALESTIEIDGETVADGSKGGRYEVTPGSHEIRVKAPGRQMVTRSVDVPSGGVAIITIEDDLGEAPQ